MTVYGTDGVTAGSGRFGGGTTTRRLVAMAAVVTTLALATAPAAAAEYGRGGGLIRTGARPKK